jgi:hypothetical protein
MLVGLCLLAGVPSLATKAEMATPSLPSPQGGGNAIKWLAVAAGEERLHTSPQAGRTESLPATAASPSLTLRQGVGEARLPAQAIAVAPGPNPPVNADAFTSKPFGGFKGATIGIQGNDLTYIKSQLGPLLDRLAGLGVRNISVIIPIFQSGWTASDIAVDSRYTPTPATLSGVLDETHKRGMPVLLRPLLLETGFIDGTHWRGNIQPDNVTTWFTNYQKILLSFGSLGAGLEAFSIGSEFNSMQTYTNNWLNMIAALRAVYPGAVTYSNNWDAQYPAFWFALDFLGVDAFYPLNAPDNASVDQLVQAWQQWLPGLDRVQAAFGKRIVFTEIGTTSVMGSHRTPWIWQPNGSVSLETQRRYYEATCRVMKGRYGGFFWWRYDFIPPSSPSTDPSYTPYGKPAEQEIARCYS